MTVTGIMVRVFVSGQGDRGSVSGRVIPKTQETQHYKVQTEGGWSNPEKRGPASKFRCRSYQKGSLRVAFDFGQPTYIYELVD